MGTVVSLLATAEVRLVLATPTDRARLSGCKRPHSTPVASLQTEGAMKPQLGLFDIIACEFPPAHRIDEHAGLQRRLRI